jgi:hypothetical protein
MEWAAPQTNLVEQTGTGTSEGIASALGYPGDKLREGLGALGIELPGNPSIGGMEIPIWGGSDYWNRVFEPTQSDVGPQTPEQRIMRRAGHDVGAGAVAAPVAGISSAVGLAESGLANMFGGLAGGGMSEITDNPIANMIATLLGSGTSIAGTNAVQKSANTQAAISGVDDLPTLGAKSGALYDEGVATGMTAPGALTQGLEAKLTDIATTAGVIAPDGTLAPKYESIGHAMKMARSYSGQDMDPTQMQQVRKALQAAAQSADQTEARIGTMMLKEFDTGIRNPRMKRGEEVDTAIKTAGTRPTSTERALGNEFSNLQRSEIRGDLTYPDDLVAAVEKAAQGSKGRQVAAGLGNLAPTPNNIVRSGLGIGSVITPAAVLAGGSGAMASGGAAGGIGLMARLLANRMAKGDANMASAVARNGGSVPVQETDVLQQLIAALMVQSTGAGPQ